MADTDATGAGTLHPLAPHHIPGFLPDENGADGLFNAMIAFVLVIAVGGGVIYLKLHSLPERMVHGASRAQFQLVAILALIALLTHQNIFWIAALLLAAFTFPDFLTPVTSAAKSLAALAGRNYADDVEEDDARGAAPVSADDPDKARG